jgi:uncharacterized protein (TIGR02246 family)
MNANEEAVAAVLAKYQDALNQSDTEAVMKLYAPMGFSCRSTRHPASAPIRFARPMTRFEAITLKVKFNVAEVHQIAADWAIARTNSAGTATVKATGGGGPEANQELFVFQKIDGAWKIARYCFSSTNPPRA